MTEPLTPPTPLHSVHTTTLVELLSQGGLSLLVSTYQAGKLIVARADGDAPEDRAVMVELHHANSSSSTSRLAD